MSSESSTLSFEGEEKINTKLVKKLVEVTDAYNSNSTAGTNKSNRRRNGVFIATEDIPLDLEEDGELNIVLTDEDKQIE
jgi:hypothetical protein